MKLIFNQKTLFIGILVVFTMAAIFFGYKIGNHYQAKKTTEIKVKYDSEHAALQKVSDQNTLFAQAAANSLSKSEFKELFKEQWLLFAKDLKIKDINHYTEANIFTEHQIKTTLRDSITSDTTHVKAFSYADASLKFSGYTLNDSLIARYKYYLQLRIASGKEERKGLWNKITLQPFKRNKIVQAVASDSNAIITNIQSVNIK